MMCHPQLVFIGAGNMARAIASGVLREGLFEPACVAASDVCAAQRAAFGESLGVEVLADNAAATRRADVLVLSVKPQVFDRVLPDIREALDVDKTLVVSVAAGVPTGRIEQMLGTGVRVVRVMPNTPALIGKGASAVCGGRWASEADLALVEQVFGGAGVVARVEEEAMNAVTAVSGSGPAYVFYLIEAMLEAAERMGLEADVARSLVLATVKGAAELCEAAGESPHALRARVCSKGGTTLAALDVFERHGVKTALLAGIEAARSRAAALAEASDVS